MTEGAEWRCCEAFVGFAEQWLSVAIVVVMEELSSELLAERHSMLASELDSGSSLLIVRSAGPCGIAAKPQAGS